MEKERIMDFDEANLLVIIDTMSRDEAKAFVLLLASEILRHEHDIIKAKLLARGVAAKFNLQTEEILETILEENHNEH